MSAESVSKEMLLKSSYPHLSLLTKYVDENVCGDEIHYLLLFEYNNNVFTFGHFYFPLSEDITMGKYLPELLIYDQYYPDPKSVESLQTWETFYKKVGTENATNILEIARTHNRALCDFGR